MSVEAITWALKQPVEQTTAKFVLVVLANCASAVNQHAYPSIAYLCNATAQNRKTVMANLQRLCEMGYIEDTGKKVGATNRVVIYRLRTEIGVDGGQLAMTFEGRQQQKGTEKGTIQNEPKIGTIEQGNGPKNGVEWSQNRDTEPSGTVVCVDAGARGSEAPVTYNDRTVSARAAAAIMLRSRGMRITSEDPNLIAALDEGVTLSALAEVASTYPDKPAAYVIQAARRIRAEAPTSTPTAGTTEAKRAPERRVAGHSPEVKETPEAKIAETERFWRQQVRDGTTTEEAAEREIARVRAKYGAVAA